MALRRPTYDMDPIATWLDYQLPKLMVEQARIERAENKQIKQQKDQIAAKRVETAINSLTPNSTEEEYQNVTAVLDGFNDLYSDDKLMSEYAPLFGDMMDGKIQKQQQSVEIKSELDRTLENIQNKVKSPHDSKGLTELVDNAEKFYASNIANISKGEAEYYKGQINEMSSAATLAHTLNEFMAETATDPNDLYQAKAISANDTQYQETWDNAYDSYLAGDYTSARTFINSAKTLKGTSEQTYKLATEGLSEYFEMVDGEYQIKDKWIDETIPVYNEYTGQHSPTNVGLYAGGALGLYESGNYKDALSALKKLPRSIGQSRKVRARVLMNEMKDGSKAVNSILRTLDPKGVLANDASSDGNDDTFQAAYKVLKTLQTKFPKDSNDIMIINDQTTDAIEQAISEMVNIGEGDYFFDRTGDTLESYLDSYNSAKKAQDSDKKHDAAEALAKHLAGNPSLVTDMDFKEGWGSKAPKSISAMNKLLKAYEVINNLRKNQTEFDNEHKHNEILSAKNS